MTLPNGTQTRTHSQWSSWSSDSRYATRPRVNAGRQGGGGRGGGGEYAGSGESGYFESGHIGSSNTVDDVDATSSSGSQDSGWIKLRNGTFVRKQSSWSSSSESSYGGVHLSQAELDELDKQLGGVKANEILGSGGEESGDHGSNSTGKWGALDIEETADHDHRHFQDG